MNEVGKKIKSLRLAKGYTGKDLETLSGVTQSTISKIESNTDYYPKVDTLLALCKALDITLTDFFSDGYETLNSDIILLIDTAKKMNPEQISKLNAFLKTI